jgi:hypothetical protein
MILPDKSSRNKSSIRKKRLPAEIEIELIETPTNAEPSINSTDDGIAIDFNLQLQNANSSMRDNREESENRIDSSDLQSEKHDFSKTRTDDGIIIDFNPVFENADSPIRSNLDPDSNVTDTRYWQSEKHDFPKIITDDGITADLKALCANANSSTCSNIEWARIVSDS